jgi:hypothetical protein
VSKTRKFLFDVAVERHKQSIQHLLTGEDKRLDLQLVTRRGSTAKTNCAKDVYNLYVYAAWISDVFPKDVLSNSSKLIEVELFSSDGSMDTNILDMKKHITGLMAQMKTQDVSLKSLSREISDLRMLLNSEVEKRTVLERKLNLLHVDVVGGAMDITPIPEIQVIEQVAEGISEGGHGEGERTDPVTNNQSIPPAGGGMHTVVNHSHSGPRVGPLTPSMLDASRAQVVQSTPRPHSTSPASSSGSGDEDDSVIVTAVLSGIKSPGLMAGPKIAEGSAPESYNIKAGKIGSW